MNDLYLLIMAILVAVVVLTVVLLLKINHRPSHDHDETSDDKATVDDEYVDKDLTVTLINQPSLIKPGLVKPLKPRTRPVSPQSGLANTAMMHTNMVQESDFK